MENKLELKHLAPYLPYGLRIAYGNNSLHKEMVVGPISDLETTSILTILDKQPFLKPLLIPLSELTEEQWIEVFKVGFIDIGHEVRSKGQGYIQSHANAIEIIYAGMSASYDMVNKQFCTDIYCFNQLTAFNKLFELHADVYGLLEAGLALNKLEHGK